MDKCTEAWNIIKEVVGSLSFELLKRGAKERNARTSERLRKLVTKGDHPWPWQQQEFIARTSERLRELAAKGDHPWQQREFIEANSKQTSARMPELAAKGVFGIAWTADVDEAIMRMIKDGISYKKMQLNWAMA